MIPHTCGKSDTQLMEIIKKGKQKIGKKTEKTCHVCECVFNYVESDIQHDRDGYYVICPMNGCNAFIAV